MDTDFKSINCKSNQITAQEILDSGNYFSGSIYASGSNSWFEFNLVNKEKMAYILSGIDLTEEVNLEIQTYAQYPEKIQRQSDWDKFD